VSTLSREALLELSATAPRLLGELAVPVPVIPAETPCLQVEQLLAASAPGCNLLVDDGSRLGLLMRDAFLGQMSGRYGYGRALFHRHAVRALADWEPVTLASDTTVEEAAAVILGRVDANARAYHDLVAVGVNGRPGLVPVSSVLRGLAGRLALQALHDPLTGLANRTMLVAELHRRSAGGGGQLAVIFVDLDGFKWVNDSMGHNVGDVLLRRVADRLRRVIRPPDLAVRLGGDEFAVLLSLAPGDLRRLGVGSRTTAAAGAEAPDGTAGADGAGATAEGTEAEDGLTARAGGLGQRILTALAEPTPVGATRMIVRASVGVAVSRPAGCDPDLLLREADLAMYRAKHEGGNRVEVVTEVGTVAPDPVDLLLVDDTLEQALAGDQFRLHYQPIVAATDGSLRAVEALVRWEHPERGPLAPALFLPAVERSGLAERLDGWVISTACAQAVEWDRLLGAAAPPRVNINIGLRTLTGGDLVRQVTEALNRTGLAAGRLAIEIPETATLQQLDAARATLQRLRRLGVGLIIDDMGSAASSLQHVTRLDVDGIKIDRSFVAGMLSNDRDRVVVRLLVELARALDVQIVAEGVETAAQLNALVELGCQDVQGYLTARPMPAAALTDCLLRQPPDRVACFPHRHAIAPAARPNVRPVRP